MRVWKGYLCGLLFTIRGCWGVENQFNSTVISTTFPWLLYLIKFELRSLLSLSPLVTQHHITVSHFTKIVTHLTVFPVLWAVCLSTPQSRFVCFLLDVFKHNSTWEDDIPFPLCVLHCPAPWHLSKITSLHLFSLPPLLIDTLILGDTVQAAPRSLCGIKGCRRVPLNPLCEAWQSQFLYPQKQSLPCLGPLRQHISP